MKTDINPELLRQAVAASNDGLVIADARLPDMPLVYVNPAFERLTGYRAEEVLGKNCRFLQRDDTHQDGLDELRLALKSGESCVVTVRNYRKDGSPFWNELSVAPIVERAGQIKHFVGNLSDVTNRVLAEQHLIEKHQRLEKTKRMLQGLALKDALTGLYNRRYFSEQVEREWNRARREQLPVSLFMIDIDHFKRFNDSFGHLCGDRCICAVADAVQRCFARGSDLVARYGGEEFVVLATGVERRHARERAELLRRAISALTIDGATRSGGKMITVSVGVATAVPDDRILPEDLLLAADRSLYQAKRLGRDRVVQAPSLRAYADAA
ncbi:MAG TPA: diguanylate cyclase [Burkholderiales bacterium]|nr:diguanylate cyclase [Burkholderiales bacterium]